MSRCLRCGRDTTFGGLCDDHAQGLATCGDITAEQIAADAEVEPSAWLIDQWGSTRPLGEVTTFGRSSADCDFSILHHSISAVHAQLECEESSVARLVDRGSLNGSFVNGESVRSAKLFDGDIVRFGDVSFYFSLSPVPAITAEGGTGRTVPSRTDELTYTARLQVADRELVLSEIDDGGIARTKDLEISFGKLEFSLLKALIERRRERSSPSAAYLSARELAELLEFQSALADSDNVRELVRRVRRKLKKVACPDLIHSRQGAGYRLAWPIKPSR